MRSWGGLDYSRTSGYGGNSYSVQALISLSLSIAGALLIDEMNVRETYQFDRNSMKVLGFTDLGELTPPDQKNQPGNHALVMMYQPYQGSWLQPIGCFLSRGAASSSVLCVLRVIALNRQQVIAAAVPYNPAGTVHDSIDIHRRGGGRISDHADEISDKLEQLKCLHTVSKGVVQYYQRRDSRPAIHGER